MWAAVKEGKRRPSRDHLCIRLGKDVYKLSEWARRIGVPYQTLRTRMQKVMNDRAELGLIPNKLTAEESAYVLRPRRLKRVEYQEKFGYTVPGLDGRDVEIKVMPPTRQTRPTFVDPSKSPYYDLTDACFIALRRFARAENIHMVYMREIMQGEDLRSAIIDRIQEYMPAKDEMKFDKDKKENWWLWLNLYPENNNE